MALFKRVLRHYALSKGLFKRSYVRFCKPGGTEYAEFLKRHGKFYSIGQNCSINLGANITDPAYVRLGNNVSLSDCTLLGHDGSVAVLNNAYNVKIDSVGKVDIKDNVFIGHGAIVMPGVTIGPNSIVGAGAVVTKDVKEGDIVGGIPARPISRMDDLVRRLQEQTELLPWAHIIKNRSSAFDPSVEQELVAMRAKFFYSDTVIEKNTRGSTA
jgi:acetyltransferase-like isoleucine patch superfamily enzyme